MENDSSQDGYQNMNFAEIGLQVPTLLLPRDGTPYADWAVVACDQYTWQPEYWEQVRRITEGMPSTLNLIFPEVYLESEERERIIGQIHRSMEEYLDQGMLVPQKPGFALVDRQTPHAASRKGLIVALDLEEYDYREGAQTLIRTTEGTLVERLPPRIAIRENAPIEVPHIMVLIDDPEKTVIEPLFERKLETLYDFPLMQGGGHLRGYRVDQEELIRQVAERLARLADPELFSRKYGVEEAPVLLYAMGDGNHSFATAEEIWEKLKREAGDREAIMRHPARHALVELINVHDEGLEFELIHRLVYDVDVDGMLEDMERFYRRQRIKFARRMFASREEWENGCQQLDSAHHCVLYVAEGRYGALWIDDPHHHLEVASLQTFLDAHLEMLPRARMDYIHGEEAVVALGERPGNIGFFFPAIPKHDLFKTIILDGAFPRKTFSMGEADEKRFYLECRQIVP